MEQHTVKQLTAKSGQFKGLAAVLIVLTLEMLVLTDTSSWVNAIIEVLESSSRNGALCALFVADDLQSAVHGHFGKLKAADFKCGLFCTCSFLASSRNRYQFFSNFKELMTCNSHCQHVHLKASPDIAAQPINSLAHWTPIASWAIASSFELGLARLRGSGGTSVPPLMPENAGHRIANLSSSTRASNEVAWMGMCRGRPPLSKHNGLAMPWRIQADSESSAPDMVIYAGASQARWRRSTTKWSTPFLPGFSGEQSECTVRYHHWIFHHDQRLLRESITSRAGTPLACECALGT